MSFHLGPCASLQAAVNDDLRQAPLCRVRAKWCCLAIFAFVSWVIFDLRALWLPSLGAMPLAASGFLAVLLSNWPLRAIAVRRTAGTSWWFDALVMCVTVAAVVGVWIDDGVLLIIGLLPAWLVVGEIALALYRVEWRYPVKVYSRARGLLFAAA